eukprot:2776649-Pyramimonas_sp.AAC.2
MTNQSDAGSVGIFASHVNNGDASSRRAVLRKLQTVRDGKVRDAFAVCERARGVGDDKKGGRIDQFSSGAELILQALGSSYRRWVDPTGGGLILQAVDRSYRRWVEPTGAGLATSNNTYLVTTEETSEDTDVCQRP